MYVCFLPSLQAKFKALYMHKVGLCRLYICLCTNSFSMMRMQHAAENTQAIGAIMQ